MSFIYGFGQENTSSVFLTNKSLLWCKLENRWCERANMKGYCMFTVCTKKYQDIK